MRKLTLSLAIASLALSITGCEKSTDSNAQVSEDAQKTEKLQVPATPPVHTKPSNPSILDEILASQPEETQARYAFRHPKETLEFFGVKPGMTIVEGLPGGGWYTKILLPLLGSEGKLIGANYAQDIWPKFGFFDEEQLEKFKTWTTDWIKETGEWGIEGGAEVHAVELGSIPEELNGSADLVLFVRAMHNLARFNNDGGYLDTTLAETFKMLKPGGIVGIVQHEGREEMADEWAGGQNGYLKKSFVINKMKEAGFELVGEININENPKDQPTDSDIVWRLPPTLYTSRENPELKEKMIPLGESHRMTLKFRKPS